MLKNIIKYILKKEKPLCFINNIKNTAVKKSNVHGYGLFATAFIPKGTLLCKIQGQLMTFDDYKMFQSSKLPPHLFIEKTQLCDKYILAVPFRTSYSFINHNNKLSHTKEFFCKKTNTLYVKARRDIKKDEEIFDTYNLEHHIDILGGFKR